MHLINFHKHNNFDPKRLQNIAVVNVKRYTKILNHVKYIHIAKNGLIYLFQDIASSSNYIFYVCFHSAKTKSSQTHFSTLWEAHKLFAFRDITDCVRRHLILFQFVCSVNSVLVPLYLIAFCGNYASCIMSTLNTIIYVIYVEVATFNAD